jgi:hypothetical protein
MSRWRVSLLFLLPVALSVIMHWRVFSLDVMGIHVWRQAQTQTVIYHFQHTANNILNSQRFDLTSGTSSLRYEFPIYQWLIAQVNRSIGYSVAHTRAITFLVFAVFLLGFFRLIAKFHGQRVALVTNALLCFSPLLYYYCVNPLPDLAALCCATWALTIYFAVRQDTRGFVLFSLLISLATLIKLPYILFAAVAAPELWKLIRTGAFRLFMLRLIVLLLILSPAICWYAQAIPTWTNNPVTHGMLDNSKTPGQLLDILSFNLLSSVPELLTNYASCVFLVWGIIQFFRRRFEFPRVHYVTLFLILAGYFLFEMNQIGRTHEYYLMPFLPLVFLLVAQGVSAAQQGSYSWLVPLAICLVPLTAWLRIDHRWNAETPGFQRDYLVHQDALNKLVPRDAICVIDKDETRFVCLYYLKRYGYSLQQHGMATSTLSELYGKGARYIFTEDPSWNPSDYPSFQFEQLFSGNVRVYRIR